MTTTTTTSLTTTGLFFFIVLTATLVFVAGDGAGCRGTTVYTTCSNGLGEKRMCESQPGCEWTSTGPSTYDGFCSGTNPPCEDLNTAASCESTTGCNWYEDLPNADEYFYEAITPLPADFECLPFALYPSVCEKCRPSRDGYVCYREVSYAATSYFMQIDGEDCESCTPCSNAESAFDCGNLIQVSNEDRVVGRDCNGNLIYKRVAAPPDPTPSPTPPPPGPIEWLLDMIIALLCAVDILDLIC